MVSHLARRLDSVMDRQRDHDSLWRGCDVLLLFNEGAGTIVRNLTGRRNGSLVGCSWKPGKLNTGTQGVLVNNVPDAKSKFTYAFRAAITTGADARVIFTRTIGGDSIVWASTSSNRITIEAPYIFGLTGTSSVVDGKMRTWIVTRDGSAWRLYRDGILDLSFTQAAVGTNPISHLSIGYDSSGLGSAGAFDYEWFASWSRVLTPTEIDRISRSNDRAAATQTFGGASTVAAMAGLILRRDTYFQKTRRNAGRRRH